MTPPEPEADMKSGGTGGDDSAAPWTLRVLAGPQAGGTVALEPARYTMGSNSDCDIVLTEPGVEPVHVEAFFADGTLSLLRCHGPAWVDGSPASDMPLDLAPFQVLTLAGTALAHGGEAGPWPDAETVQAHLAAAASSNAPDAPDAPAAPDAPDAPAPDTEPQGASTAGRSRSPWRRLPAPVRWIAAGSAAAALAGAILLWTVSGPRASLLDVARATRGHQAQTLAIMLMRNPAFADTRLERAADGTRTLCGYVETKATLAALRALARNDPLRFEVVSLEQLRDSVDVLLSREGLMLEYTLEPGDDGLMRLTVRGVVDMAGTVGSFENILRRELPGIDHIDSRIITWKSVEQRLQVLRNSAPQYAGIRVRMEGGGLTVTGTILQNFADGWRSMLDSIVSSLPITPEVTASLIVGPGFAGQVESLITGPNPSARMSFPGVGSRLYSVGSALPDGLVVAGITPDHLTFSNGEDEFVLPVRI